MRKRQEPQDTPEIEIGVGEEAVISMPLVSASDLLPPTPEEIPPTESTATPRGEVKDSFLIEKNRFGPGTWGVDFIHSDGTLEPLGLWLDREHHSESGADVANRLAFMGLPQEHAVRFGRQRQTRIDGQIVIDDLPGVKSLAAEEAKHYEMKDEFAKAFVQAQAKKEGKR